MPKGNDTSEQFGGLRFIKQAEDKPASGRGAGEKDGRLGRVLSVITHHRPDLAGPFLAETGKIWRDVNAAVPRHQILKPVEVAAESKILHRQRSVTVRSVKINHDDLGAAVGLPDREKLNHLAIAPDQDVLLEIVDGEVDELVEGLLERDFVPAVHVSGLVKLNDDEVSAMQGSEDVWVREQLVLERGQA